MKKLILSAIVLLATVTSYAASSGSFVISGTVASVNDIIIEPNMANKDSLNIVAGETAKNVANVIESSNNLNGYVIKMSSANASKLVHSNPLYFTNYTASYDGGSYVSLTTTPQIVKTSPALTGLTTDNANAVNVNVNAFASAPAGYYSDTITISIEAL